MAKEVKFDRLHNLSFAQGSSKDADTIYFTNDTHQIVLGGQIYGSSQTVGSANLNLKAEGTTVKSFSANATTAVDLDFQGELGVSVLGDSTNGVIKITGTNHHIVDAKTEVVRAKKDRGVSLAQLYIQQIHCQNLGETLHVANLHDITSSDVTGDPTTYTLFTKTEVDDDFYIGLFGANATAGRGAFNITVQHTSGYVEYYKFLVVEDTPGNGTFAFVTDIPWPCIARVGDIGGSSGSLACFMKLPKDFVGSVKFQPRRSYISAGANWHSLSKDSGSLTQTPYYLGPYSSGRTNNLRRNNSVTITNKFTLAQVEAIGETPSRTNFPEKPGGNDGPVNPIGKYEGIVNMIVDLGNVTVGGYVTDFEINDMLLHELESKVDNHDIRISALETAVTPSIGYWTYQNGGIYANNHSIFLSTPAGDSGQAELSFDADLGAAFMVDEELKISSTGTLTMAQPNTETHSNTSYELGSKIVLDNNAIDFFASDYNDDGEGQSAYSTQNVFTMLWEQAFENTYEGSVKIKSLGYEVLEVHKDGDEDVYVYLRNSYAGNYITLSYSGSINYNAWYSQNDTDNGFGNHFFNSDIIIASMPSGSGKTGKVEAPGGFFQTSDIRKKNVLGELDLNKAYDLIDKCQTILYSLKDNPDRVDIGLIAQEVQQFFPEIVSEDSEGMLSLDYAKLTVVILRVLKDLIARVSKLELK